MRGSAACEDAIHSIVQDLDLRDALGIAGLLMAPNVLPLSTAKTLAGSGKTYECCEWIRYSNKELRVFSTKPVDLGVASFLYIQNGSFQQQSCFAYVF